MTDNREEINFIKIETKGFYDLCERITELETENTSLKKENEFLQTELHDIKQMSMWEFGNTYCTSESLEADGHAFAQSLLGGK